jgi:hypothetical protein
VESIEIADTSVSEFANAVLVQCRMTMRTTGDWKPTTLNLGNCLDFSGGTRNTRIARMNTDK